MFLFRGFSQERVRTVRLANNFLRHQLAMSVGNTIVAILLLPKQRVVWYLHAR